MALMRYQIRTQLTFLCYMDTETQRSQPCAACCADYSGHASRSLITEDHLPIDYRLLTMSVCQQI